MMLKPHTLKTWLHKKQLPGIEVAFVSGMLIDWILARFLQFGSRRVLILSLFSFRYLYCLREFVWFSWQDLIFHISLLSLMVGVHYGAMENFKKTGQGLRTARLLSLILSLVIVALFVPALISKILISGYIPNVFDEARLIIAFKAISQIYRNLENAIQIRRGTPPLPLGRLLGTEISLVVLFISLVNVFGTLPTVLFWVILLDALIPEIVQWKWVLAQPYRKKIKWTSLKDFKKWPEINVSFLFSCIVGSIVYSERFLLVGLTSGLGEQSVAMYFYLLPLVSMTWRFPHLFHRYFRKDQGLLNQIISKNLFYFVLSLSLIFGLILFTVICAFFESTMILPFVILLMGPVSSMLAYSWYRGEVHKFILIFFWVLKIFGLMDATLPIGFTLLWILSNLYQITMKSKWTKLSFKFHRGSPTGVTESLKKKISFPIEIKSLYGKIYTAETSPENIPELKKQIFALSLGSVEFNPKIEADLSLPQASGFIPLGSLKNRKLNLSNDEAEFVLNKIKKSLGQGHAKAFSLRSKPILFGTNSSKVYGLMPSES